MSERPGCPGTWMSGDLDVRDLSVRKLSVRELNVCEPVQPQAGKCQTKGLRRYTRHADRFWIYMLIYSPQQNETKADIAVSGSSIRLQAGHFTFLSWQVARLPPAFLSACLLTCLLACLLASRLLACLPTSRSPGFPYLPSNRCCMDR